MTTKNHKNGRSKVSTALADWLNCLSDLLKTVKDWAEAMDWSTRQISKRMEDSELGAYEAPALLMQKDTARVLLDPIGRDAPGAEGVVDLYLMPAYDDIATLLLVDGQWQLHYLFEYARDSLPAPTTESKRLSKKTLTQVLDEMTAHAAKSI